MADAEGNCTPGAKGYADDGENIFGKRRGRFDEGAARRADRSLCHAAIAALVAMPDDELLRFGTVFNEVFRPVSGRPGWRMSKVQA